MNLLMFEITTVLYHMNNMKLRYRICKSEIQILGLFLGRNILITMHEDMPIFEIVLLVDIMNLMIKGI